MKFCLGSMGSLRLGMAAAAGVALLATVATSGQAAGAILIDDFSTKTGIYPLTVNVDSFGFTGFHEAGLTGTIGGGRGVQVGNSTMDADGFDEAAVSVFTTPPFSFFDYSSTVGAEAQANLQYGNASTVPDLNLNATGETVLRLDLLDFDGPAGQGLTVQALIISSAGGGVFALPDAFVIVPGAQTVNLSLATLSPATLADIDGIQISFLAPKSGDFRIDTVSLAVPEPATLSLLALGAVPVLLRRKADKGSGVRKNS